MASLQGSESFNVEFYERNNPAQRLPDPNPEIVVDFYRWNSVGGPIQAILFAQGDEQDLWSLLSMLGQRLCITDGFDQPVWWGCVEEVTTTCGGVKFGYSIKNLANSVVVEYSDGGETKYTDPAIDQCSIDAYGLCEIVYAADVSLLSEALAKRDEIIAKSSTPTRIFEILESNNEDPQTEITAQGTWTKLNKTFCDDVCNLDPYDGTSGSGSGSVGFGIQYTSDELVFRLEENRLCDLSNNLPFSANQQFIISNTGTACDGVLASVQSAASGNEQSCADQLGGMDLAVASTPDNPLVLIDQNALNSLSSFIGANTLIRFTDGLNGGVYAVTGSIVNSNTIELVEAADNGSSGPLQFDTSLTEVCAGHCLQMAEPATCTAWAVDGTTLTGQEQQLAQKIVIPNDPECECQIGAIRLQIGLSPDADDNIASDDIIVELQTIGGGGFPSGNTISSSTISAAQLEEGVTWVDFEINPLLILPPSSEIWLVVRRSGPPSLAHYLIGTSSIPDAPGGPAYVSADGVTWQVPYDKAYSILHQVVCQIETTQRIADLATLSPMITEVCVLCDSGIMTDVKCDVGTPIGTQIQTLIEQGTIDGLALCITIDKDGRLTIDCEGGEGNADTYFIDCQRNITSPSGQPISDHLFRPCHWLQLVGGYPSAVHLPMADSGQSSVYITETEYSATSQSLRVSGRDGDPIWARPSLV